MSSENSYELRVLSKELRDNEKWRKAMMIENCYFCHLFKF
jgi:hypothetical protein